MRRLVLLLFLFVMGCVNDDPVTSEVEDALVSVDGAGAGGSPGGADFAGLDLAGLARDARPGVTDGIAPPDATSPDVPRADTGVAPLDATGPDATGPDATGPDDRSHVTGGARFADVAAARGHAGIVVDAQGTPFATATDEDGRFALDLPPGRHTLRFRADAYAGVDVAVEATPGQVEVPLVILVPIPGRIEGTVVPPPDMDPVSFLRAAQVHLAFNDVFDQELAVQAPEPFGGRFAFEIAERTTYFLFAEAEGYGSAVVSVEAVPGQVVDVGELVLRPFGPPPRASGVRGLARRAGAEDHGGIVVETLNAPFATRTAADGRYQLDLPPGAWSLRFSAEGHAAELLNFVDVEPDAVVELQDIVLVPLPGRIVGVVALPAPEGPVDPSIATVVLAASDAPGAPFLQVAPDPEGAFSMDALSPGGYVVTVSADGFRPLRAAADVGAGQVVDLGTLRLEADVGP